MWNCIGALSILIDGKVEHTIYSVYVHKAVFSHKSKKTETVKDRKQVKQMLLSVGILDVSDTVPLLNLRLCYTYKAQIATGLTNYEVFR